MARRIALVLFLGLLGLAILMAFDPNRDVTTSSEEAYQHYKAAVEHHDQFYFRKAMERYEQAVALDSHFAIAQARLANTYQALGFVKRSDEMRARAYASREFVSEREQLWLDLFKAQWEGNVGAVDSLSDAFYKTYPDDIEAISQVAYRYFNKGDFEQSLEKFQELANKFPDHAPTYNMLGYLNYYLGRYDEALAMLDKYLEYSRDQANPHDSRGEILHAIGRYEEAIVEFRQAFNINPEFDVAVLHLAQSYQALGQNRQTDYCFEILANQQPNDVKRLQFETAHAGMLASREDYEGAKRLLSRVWDTPLDAYKEKTANADGAVTLGWVYYRERNRDSLSMLWDRLHDIAEVLAADNKGFLEGDGYKRIKKVVEATTADLNGDLALAETLFSELITEADLPDQRLSYRIFYADVLVRQGKHDLAISELQKNLSLNPNSAKTLARLGDVYEAASDPASAQAYRERAATVWKSADPDYRPLINLRKKLQIPLAAAGGVVPAAPAAAN